MHEIFVVCDRQTIRDMRHLCLPCDCDVLEYKYSRVRDETQDSVAVVACKSQQRLSVCVLVHTCNQSLKLKI